jgi:hypothetical protein
MSPKAGFSGVRRKLFSPSRRRRPSPSPCRRPSRRRQKHGAVSLARDTTGMSASSAQNAGGPLCAGRGSQTPPNPFVGGGSVRRSGQTTSGDGAPSTGTTPRRLKRLHTLSRCKSNSSPPHVESPCEFGSRAFVRWVAAGRRATVDRRREPSRFAGLGRFESPGEPSSQCSGVGVERADGRVGKLVASRWGMLPSGTRK